MVALEAIAWVAIILIVGAYQGLRMNLFVN